METLNVAEQTHFQLGNYQLKIIAYLGCFTPNIYSFKVSFQAEKTLILTRVNQKLIEQNPLKVLPKKKILWNNLDS